jgi:hypothetical protein
MYARVARFEGGDPALLDQQAAEMKAGMAAARAGSLPDDAAPGSDVLMETIVRFVELVDRRTGTSVGIAFCKTEDDVRRADEALNGMSPSEGGGKRTGVEIFEVLLDESFG